MTTPTPAELATPQTVVEASETAHETAELETAVDDKGANAEAAKWRKKLRDTETERDTLTDVLTRTRQAQVDAALSDAGVDPRLFAAAGHSIESLVGEDGLIDTGKLADAVKRTASEFHVPEPSRRPAPNPLMGQGGSPSTPESGATTWDNVFKGV